MTKNRGSAYGETLFTTVGINESSLIFWQDHLVRLIGNCNTFFFLDELTEAELNSLMIRITKKAKTVDLSIYNALRIEVELVGDMRIGMMPSLENVVVNVIPKTVQSTKSTSLTIQKFEKYADPELVKPKLNDYFWENYYVRRARKKGFSDVLFINNQIVTEASTSNIFFVKDTTLVTPEIKSNVLSGVYRKHLIKLAKSLDIEATVRDIKVEEITSFDGAFLTNSVKGITPVEKIDEKQFDLSLILAMVFKLNKEMSEYRKEYEKEL